jgi:hydroxypyruvate isomerase
MRFSANLGFLFADRPYPERIRAAAAAGFEAVEMHWPYDVSAHEVRATLKQCGVAMLGLNTPLGGGEDFGLGALPGREGEFQAGVDMALAYAAEIGAASLHCMAGVTGSHAALFESTFARNIATAAKKAARLGVMILLEPINGRDKPGYFLSSVEQAAALIGKIGRSNVKIMFDCYHVQIAQGDLTARLRTHLDLIGHVQIASVPERAEPDSGELDCLEICRTLDRLGYAGWIGAEYKPRGKTEEGLAWLRAFRQ